MLLWSVTWFLFRSTAPGDEIIVGKLFAVSGIWKETDIHHVIDLVNERSISFGAYQHLVALFSILELCSTKWNISALYCTSQPCMVLLHCTASNYVQIGNFLHSYCSLGRSSLQYHRSRTSSCAVLWSKSPFAQGWLKYKSRLSALDLHIKQIK